MPLGVYVYFTSNVGILLGDFLNVKNKWEDDGVKFIVGIAAYSIADCIS